MQIKFLKSIVENLIDKSAVPIVDLLVGKKHVNEFLIAKKLDLTINQTRNILYKLSDYGLVSFTRKKDKRKGWYIYFWTLNVYQSLNLLEQNLKKELENLNFQLKDRKQKRHYVCNTCSIEVNEESALLNNFACPECEEIYELSDDQEIIKKLEKDISKIKRETQLVTAEKNKEQDKIEKKKAKEIKKLEQERARLKKKARKKAAKGKPKAKKKVKKKKKKPKAKKKVKKKPKLKKKLKKVKPKLKKKLKKVKKKIFKKPAKKKVKPKAKKKSIKKKR